jgi:hypothetical protein
MLGFVGTSDAISLIGDLHNLQFAVAHALVFTVFTSRLLTTDLK